MTGNIWILLVSTNFSYFSWSLCLMLAAAVLADSHSCHTFTRTGKGFVSRQAQSCAVTGALVLSRDGLCSCHRTQDRPDGSRLSWLPVSDHLSTCTECSICLNASQRLPRRPQSTTFPALPLDAFHVAPGGWTPGATRSPIT